MTQTQPTEQTAPSQLLESLSSSLVPELKRYLKHHNAEVEAMIAPGGEQSGQQASNRYAKVVDGLVKSLFHTARGVMLPANNWHPVALGAVGSYGRSTLSIFSDLDVRLLCDGDPARVQGVAEALLYPLWDAGLNIGHQVMTLDDGLELALTDLPTATSLLDWRYLDGETELTERFQQRAYDEVFNLERLGDFLGRLSSLAQERKERFGGSVFLLEPELKSGAGGLRDVDLMHWAARARWRVSGISDLVRVGVLLPDEWSDLSKAVQFVLRVRNSLHHRTKKRVDRLGFQEQEALGELFGYGTGGAGAEAFMSDYYRHAREIELASEVVLRRAAPPSKLKVVEKDIGDGLRLVGDAVALSDEDAIFVEPSLVFRLYEEAIHRECGVLDKSRRAVMRAVSADSFCEQLRSDPECGPVFRRLVCTALATRFKYGSVLTELHEVGLLTAMIPEFNPVVGRVHHDVYHVYTVDVHSVAAVDKLRAIFRGDLAESQGLATRLVEEIKRPEVLFFAALLHDIGKDEGGKNHADRGAEMARAILTRLRFPEDRIHGVQHLIRKHLKMYLVATRRDIDDPRTLESFSDEVEGVEGLRELYLLTVCDVSTTSPTALTSWKQRMLNELFYATDRWLTLGETRRAGTEAVTAEVLELLDDSVSETFAEAFLSSLPARYLGANNSEWIVRHMQLAEAAQGTLGEITVVRNGQPHVEVAVVTDDEPGALARICATFSRHKLKVVSAQLYSFRDPDGKRRVLDLFWVRAGQDPDLVAELIPRMNETLSRLCAGDERATDLVASRRHDVHWSRRPSPSVPIQVRVDNEGASRHTIVEVIAKDRADLLFWMAETFYEAGLSIELAKIHTEGVRVTDVFYVCTEDGNKLLDEEKLTKLKNDMARTLAELEG